MLLEVLQERRHGLVHLGGGAAHRFEVAIVRVPAAVVDGDVRHAVFDEAARRQQLLADLGVAAALRRAVALAQRVLLAREVERLRRLAEDDVARGRAGRLERGVRRQTVERAAAREALLDLLLELGRPQAVRVHPARRHDAVHVELLRARPAARHERRVRLTEEADLGEAALRAREDHERRQFALVEHTRLHGVLLEAGALHARGGDQRAERGERHAAAGVAPRLHEVRRRLVPEERMRHRADDRVEVGALRQLGHPFVELNAGVRLDRLQAVVVVMRRVRLGVERLQLRGTAPEPDLDDALGELPRRGL